MTDTAAEGSVAQPSAASAGTPEVQTAGADNGSAAAASPDPFAGLSEGTRSWVETKGYKSPEDIVTAYRNAEQKLGSAITPPKDDAPAEEWDRFYGKLGRPEAAEKYEFKLPEGLPESLPYNQDLANTSKAWMFEAGLNQRQAQTVHDKFAGFMAAQQQQALEAQAQAVTTTHDDLVKEWGPQDSEGFKAKLELTNRAVKKLGLMDALQKNGLVLADGAVTDPQIAKAFAVIGETMFKEDTIGADGAPQYGNPFKPGPDGKRNITAMTALKKSDPAKARRLAQEAGEDPRKWGL